MTGPKHLTVGGQCDASCTADCGHCKGASKTSPSWTYGDLYATPPVLHTCNRCGQQTAHMALHDEVHAHREAEAAIAGLLPAAPGPQQPDEVEALARRLQQADPDGLFSALTDGPLDWNNPHTDREHYRTFAAALLAAPSAQPDEVRRCVHGNTRWDGCKACFWIGRQLDEYPSRPAASPAQPDEMPSPCPCNLHAASVCAYARARGVCVRPGQHADPEYRR